MEKRLGHKAFPFSWFNGTVRITFTASFPYFPSPKHSEKAYRQGEGSCCPISSITRVAGGVRRFFITLANWVTIYDYDVMLNFTRGRGLKQIDKGKEQRNGQWRRQTGLCRRSRRRLSSCGSDVWCNANDIIKIAETVLKYIEISGIIIYNVKWHFMQFMQFMQWNR